jgi:hypothetical protein
VTFGLGNRCSILLSYGTGLPASYHAGLARSRAEPPRRRRAWRGGDQASGCDQQPIHLRLRVPSGCGLCNLRLGAAPISKPVRGS